MLSAAKVVHVDETGARIAAQRWWFHTTCTAWLSLIVCHPRRGTQACDDIGVLPAFTGTAVHDGWRPYWHDQQCRHALCGAHLLRDLAAVAEITGQAGWADAMAALLVEAKQHIYAARARGRDGLGWATLTDLGSRYHSLVTQGWQANPDPPAGRRHSKRQREAVNLLTRLKRQDHEVQASWVDFDVPFDNNAAERDLRMIKLRQEISGGFRTVAGARRSAQCVPTCTPPPSTASTSTTPPSA